MTNETASLILDGEDVPLRSFENSLTNFRQLLESLSKEISGDAGIEWVIDHLDISSTITRVRPETPRPEAVPPVMDGLMVVGRAMQVHGVIPYSATVRRSADALTGILNGRVTSLRIETSDDDVIIQSQRNGQERPASIKSFGTVTGRIQTLSSRGRYTFTLYDAVFNKAVSCYLRVDQEGVVRDKWDRRAIVEGTITRDPETGRPLNVRNIRAIEPLMDPIEGGYLPPLSDGHSEITAETTDEFIKRLRHAW